MASPPYWNRLTALALSLLARLVAAFRAEPAVVLGTIATAIVGASKYIHAHGIHTVRQAITVLTPVATSWLIRRYVTAPDTRDALVAAAANLAKQSTLAEFAHSAALVKEAVAVTTLPQGAPTVELSKVLAATEAKVFPAVVPPEAH